jgi:integrase
MVLRSCPKQQVRGPSVAGDSRGRRGLGTVTFDHRGTDCRDSRQHRTCTGVWRGQASVTTDGQRTRHTVTGATKTEAQQRLTAKLRELQQGIRTSGDYTVADAVTDWLRDGLDGRSDKIRQTYTEAVAPLLEVIGKKLLRDPTAKDVRRGLVAIAEDRSSRSVAIAHNAVTRSIQPAAAHDLVARNVAALAERPQGKAAGRPSKAMTKEVALQLFKVCLEDDGIGAYLILSMMTGCRPEEVRALRWDHVDLLNGVIHVWRSTRQHGDVKTAKSRRSLEIPQQVVDALQRRQEQQVKDRAQAAELWQETGLVFTSSIGTELDSHNVRRSMRRLTKAAGIGENWTPRELRHTFVSLLSENGVPIEEIAQLAGHSTSRTTETVYRKELRPVIRTGATVMGALMPTAKND